MIKRRGTLFVVSAPSGAGKTTLCREIRLRVPDLTYSVSVTTYRPAGIRTPPAMKSNGTFATTFDEILASVARYCQRVSDSGR